MTVPVSRSLLEAVLARIHPGADGMPDSRGTNVLSYLDRYAETDHGRHWPAISEGFARLGADFESLSHDEQDERLHAVENERWFVLLVRMATEGYYAQADSPSWPAVGYDRGPKRDPGAPIRFVQPETHPFDAIGDDPYDAVVVGGGAGGGVAACVLAEAGLNVLVVERGSVLRYEDASRDHLRNHRISLYGHNTGPGPEPREIVLPDGRPRVIDRPWDPRWLNVAMVVGGGTRVYQGMAWRFLPEDFRLASTLGVPDGSSLADWPITYDELEPYYTKVEWEMGVCGDPDAHAIKAPRSRGYPMPPMPDNPESLAYRKGAEKLGWSTGPVPFLINSEPRNGRARCVGCGQCVGFACPSDAKNGSFNTTLPRAIATGRCRLVTEVRAERVTTDGSGNVTGVRLLDLATGARREVRAGHVVLSASAIESARLLLESELGNATDQVGRHLQGHFYVSAFGIFDDPIVDMVGPGVSIATCDHYYGPDGMLGGHITNDVVKWPILHWFWARDPKAPTWGRAALESMRDDYRRTSHMFGGVQEVPHASSRVELSDVRDRWGNRVIRASGDLRPETMQAGAWLQKRESEWLEAAGARRIWEAPLLNALTASQHQAGTCRMGDDPATSVTDRWGRVHGHRNLWVMDGSVHVTNGGFNPVLTIMALAWRNAEHLTKQ